MATREDRLDVQTGLNPPDPTVSARISRTGFRDVGAGQQAAGIARGLASLQEGLGSLSRTLSRDAEQERREGEQAVQARADAEKDARQITAEHPELTAGSVPFRQGVQRELGRRSANRFKAFLSKRLVEELGAGSVPGASSDGGEVGDLGVGSTDTDDFNAVVEQAREEWIEEHAPDQRSEAFNVGFNVSASAAIQQLRVQFAENASARERKKERLGIATNATGDIRTALAEGMSVEEIGENLTARYLDEKQRWDRTNIEGRRQALASAVINYAETNDDLDALRIAENIAIGPEGDRAGRLTDRPGIGNRIEEARDRIQSDITRADRVRRVRRSRRQEEAAGELFRELNDRFQQAEGDPQDVQTQDLVDEIGRRTSLTEDQAQRRVANLREAHMARNQSSDQGVLRSFQSDLGRNPSSVTVEELNRALINRQLSSRDYDRLLRAKQRAASGERETVFDNEHYKRGIDILDDIVPEDITRLPEPARAGAAMMEQHAKEIFEQEWAAFMFSEDFAPREGESRTEHRERIQERRRELVQDAFAEAINADVPSQVLSAIGIDQAGALDLSPTGNR